jgi:LIVCS family branched-chain amino acid:cation transporter
LALEQAGISLLHGALLKLPFYTMGLGWIVPALVGMILGILLDFFVYKKN